MSIRNITFEGSSVPLKEFKLTDMVPNPSIVMVAKRGCGKSVIVKEILKKYSYIPGGAIISKTDKLNPFYGKFFPELYIHYEYRTEIITNILKRQKQISQKCEEKMKQRKKLDPRAILVMDDCLASKGTWVKDQNIMEIFFNGRHYKLMYILTMQFPLGIPPELRSNFDYIFLLAESFVSNLKRLYDHYAGMFPNFDSFRQVFNQVTEDYGSLVIVNRGARIGILESVFWFKAANSECTKFGCKQFNKFNEKNYNKDWDKKIDAPNLESFLATKKKTFKVNKIQTYSEQSK